MGRWLNVTWESEWNQMQQSGEVEWVLCGEEGKEGEVSAEKGTLGRDGTH